MLQHLAFFCFLIFKFLCFGSGGNYDLWAFEVRVVVNLFGCLVVW
jgi:hypothetical protein